MSPSRLVAALAVGGAAALAQDEVRIAFGPGEVRFGEPFALAIERSWPVDHEPEPFDDAVLLPLAVELLESRVEARRDRFVESRRYRAAAWVVGEVRLTDVVVRSRDAAGVVASATVTPPPLAVASCLPTPPGEVEWPGDVRAARRPGRGLGWLLAIGAALGGGLAFALLRRRRGALAPDEAAALQRTVAALSVPTGDDAAAVARFYLELARLVRRGAGARFHVAWQTRTTEELAAAATTLRPQLLDSLQPCDGVKYAAMRPAASAHERAKAAALAFLAAAAAEARP